MFRILACYKTQNLVIKATVLVELITFVSWYVCFIMGLLISTVITIQIIISLPRRPRFIWNE